MQLYFGWNVIDLLWWEDRLLQQEETNVNESFFCLCFWTIELVVCFLDHIALILNFGKFGYFSSESWHRLHRIRLFQKLNLESVSWSPMKFLSWQTNFLCKVDKTTAKQLQNSKLTSYTHTAIWKEWKISGVSIMKRPRLSTMSEFSTVKFNSCMTRIFQRTIIYIEKNDTCKQGN